MAGVVVMNVVVVDVMVVVVHIFALRYRHHDVDPFNKDKLDRTTTCLSHNLFEPSGKIL